nr:hypothetical protein CFP56_22215 [Quercus suber]
MAQELLASGVWDLAIGLPNHFAVRSLAWLFPLLLRLNPAMPLPCLLLNGDANSFSSTKNVQFMLRSHRLGSPHDCSHVSLLQQGAKADLHHVQHELIQREAHAHARERQVVEIAQRGQILGKVGLREPDARRGPPKPLHVPRLDLRQRRRDAAEHANDQTREHGDQRAILPFHKHADDAGEPVDVPEVQQVGDIHPGEGYERRGEHAEKDGEVKAGQRDAQERAEKLPEVVGAARVAGTGLAKVHQLLLAEYPEPRGAGCQTDGHGPEKPDLWRAVVIDGGAEFSERRLVDALKEMPIAGEGAQSDHNALITGQHA